MTTKGKPGSLSSNLLNISRSRPVAPQGQGEFFLQKPAAPKAAGPAAAQNAAAPQSAPSGNILFRKGAASPDAFRPAHWSYEAPAETVDTAAPVAAAAAESAPLAWPEDDEPPPEEPPGRRPGGSSSGLAEPSSEFGEPSSRRLIWMVVAGSCGMALVLPALVMFLALTRNTDDVTLKPLPPVAEKTAPAGPR